MLDGEMEVCLLELKVRLTYWIGTNEITSNLVSSGEARSRMSPRKCMKYHT